jgi:hypothetical protein
MIYILIMVFVCLILYQGISALGAFGLASNKTTLIEGLENADTVQEYKPYNLNDPNNSLILAQQNAGNIEVLKGRIDGLDGVKQRVDDMQQSMNLMQTQIDGLVQQQADYAQELAGSTPPTVTGTDPATADSVSTSIEEEDN